MDHRAGTYYAATEIVIARTFTSTNYLKLDSPPDAGQVGSLFIKCKPAWNSGDNADHMMWAYQTSTGDKIFVFEKYLDNTIYAGFWTGSPVNEARVIIPDTGMFTAGTWGNWLITWDTSATPVTNLYHDTTLVGSSNVFFVMPSFTGGALGIGNQATTIGAGTSPFNGDLAERARWNRVLNSGERANLAAGLGPGCIPSGLVHWVRILGDTSPEHAEVGNDLVLVGTPAQSTHPPIDNCDGLSIDPTSITATVTVPTPSVDFPPLTVTPLSIAAIATIPSPVLTSAAFAMTPSAISELVTVPSPGVNFISPKGVRITAGVRLAQG